MSLKRMKKLFRGFRHGLRYKNSTIDRTVIEIRRCLNSHYWPFILTILLLSGCEFHKATDKVPPDAPVVEPAVEVESQPAEKPAPEPSSQPTIAPSSQSNDELMKALSELNERLSSTAHQLEHMQADIAALKPVQQPASKPVVKAPAQVIGQNADGQLIVYFDSDVNCVPCVLMHQESGQVRINGKPVQWRPIAESGKTFDRSQIPMQAWQTSDGQWWTARGWYGVEAFHKTVGQSFAGGR